MPADIQQVMVFEKALRQSHNDRVALQMKIEGYTRLQFDTLIRSLLVAGENTEIYVKYKFNREGDHARVRRMIHDPRMEQMLPINGVLMFASQEIWDEVMPKRMQ